MKKETLNKIISSATILFGEKGYSATSISDISKKAGISKGILYYYVKNKDELYMTCLEDCAKKLYDFLNVKYSSTENLYEYASLREKFCSKYPQYEKILFYLMSEKPNSLSQRIHELKKPMFELDYSACSKYFEDVSLGKNVSIHDALSFLTVIQQALPSIIETDNPLPISTQISRMMNIYLNGLKQDL